MAVAGNSSANGTKVVVWKCDGGSSQQWAGYSDGTLRIHGKCLDVTGRSTAVAAKVDLWACNGGPSQRWLIGQTSQNPFGPIFGAGSGNALTDPGNSTVNGTQLEMGADNGDLSGPWHVSFHNYLRE
jgi:ricin-type beta-trefoil lectin protein